jgi:GNAT superfamily N-acetyltransferase
VFGACLAFHRRMPLPHMPLDVDRGYITLFGVDEPLRRQGYGSRLLAAAEDYLRGKGARRALISPYAPGYFWPGVDVEKYAGALPFLAANGYNEIMRPLAMETRLSELERPEWLRTKVEELQKDTAASVEIWPYHPDLAPYIHAFMVAEFPGDWERWVRDAALDIHAGRSQPDRLLFAWDNATNSVVGMVHWNDSRFGPVGTAPQVRGRGIGAWLTFEALERMRGAGKETAWFLWTDDKTAQLYKEAGFQETRRFAIMAKDLG